jgi:hypothetical protein
MALKARTASVSKASTFVIVQVSSPSEDSLVPSLRLRCDDDHKKAHFNPADRHLILLARNALWRADNVRIKPAHWFPPGVRQEGWRRWLLGRAASSFD